MPGRDDEPKCDAISPAAKVGQSRNNPRISRRVGSATATKASRLLNDGPQRLEVLVIPAFLEALQLDSAGFAQALEPVMEDLHHGAVVGRATGATSTSLARSKRATHWASCTRR